MSAPVAMLAGTDAALVELPAMGKAAVGTPMAAARSRPRNSLVGHYRLFDSHFAVETRSATVLEFLNRIYERLPHHDGVSTPARYAVLAMSGMVPGRYRVAKDDDAGECFVSLAAALYHLEWRIALQVCGDHQHLVPLHGAVVYNGRAEAAFLTGPSGAGKSTLTLGLGALGFRVGGDDLALLDPSNGTVRPVPRCFHLDARTRRLVRGMGLVLPARAARYGFVTPADLGVIDPPPRRIARLVYLGKPAEGAPSLRRLSQGELAVKLMSETPRAARSPTELLRVLQPLLESDGYLLARGRLGETAEAVAAVLEPARTAPLE